jgi:flagellar protein FlaJ
VFITYIAGVMVIITTFILVYLLNAPAISGIGASTTPQVDPNVIDLLLTTAVFDSFVIGIVAGKMGESGISDGFKHSIFLVIASLVAIAMARFFISLPI